MSSVLFAGCVITAGCDVMCANGIIDQISEDFSPRTPHTHHKEQDLYEPDFHTVSSLLPVFLKLFNSVLA